MAKSLKSGAVISSWKHDFLVNKWLYLMMVPIVLYFVIFNYVPMGGLLMAFEDYKPQRGIFGSE